jgi:hypothetical protein
MAIMSMALFSFKGRAGSANDEAKGLQNLVDGDGRERKRTVLTTPAAATIVDLGQIENMRFFHAPFPAKQDRWEHDNALSVGNGLVRGKLVYAKSKAPDSKHPSWISVKVTGELKNPEVKEGGSVMKNLLYKVEGEQTYDSTAREWVAGKHTLTLSFDLYVLDELRGVATGTVIAGLSKRPIEKE